MAHKLAELGVDILEAGFPIASEGDFEAVDAVSREFPWVQVAALARACTLDIERAAQALEARASARASTPSSPPATSTSSTSSKKSRQQVLDEAVAAVELARALRRRRGVLGRGRHAHRPGLPGADLAGGRRRRRPHGQHPGHGRLLGAGGVRRADRPHRAGARRLARSSASTATTTSAWRSPTPSPPSRPARARSSAPSTASASAPATARSKRS